MKPTNLPFTTKKLSDSGPDKSSVTKVTAPDSTDAEATLWSRYSWFGFRKTRADRGLFITSHRLQSGEAAPNPEFAVAAPQPVKREQSEAVSNWEDEGGTTAAAKPGKIKSPDSAR